MTALQISPWLPTLPNASPGRQSRNVSYIIPFKSVKCNIRDEVVYCNFDDYVSTISLTSIFEASGVHISSCETRTCVMWDSIASTRIIVTTQVKWTGRSFIKGIVDVDSQKTQYKRLERAMREHIKEHQSEFTPKGVDLDAISSSAPESSNSAMSHISPIANHPVSTNPETSPSIVTVGGIRELLSTETGVDTLLTLEAPKIPPILDLLQTEIRQRALDHEYRRKCGKCLRFLVNKYHVLPPSLFVNVTIRDENPLAIGGYSDIYNGTFQNQSVCLKVLRIHVHRDEERTNKQLREFYKEALLWTQLSHPNLLSFLGVNTALFPRRLCLVSPWMVNGEITSFLELHPNHDKLRVTSEIAAGISYLHSHNIVHGDIKGANVLVDEHGRCYLGDFGLATATMTTTLLSSTTNTGKGTMRWMAPELFGDHSNSEDTPKPDHLKLAIDIYAYACTIYEIISGKLPFEHLTDAQVMFQVVAGKRPERPKPELMNWCPDNIWALVQQCWAQESRSRPTAAELHAFLSRLERLRGEGLPWEKEFLNPE